MKLNKDTKPLLFVFLYVLVIPLFAILYYFFAEPKLDFIDSMYFSTVTITTLGYGDIVPENVPAKVLVSFEAILGIVLIGAFLNTLSHNISYRATQKEKEAQKEKDLIFAKNRFLNFNKIVEQKIERYYSYIVSLTKGKDENGVLEANKNFSFNDLYDLYEPSLRMSDSFFTPKIDFYYESQKELLKTLEELISFGYIENWQELEKTCLDFIVKVKNNDYSDTIVNQKNTTSGGEKYTDTVSKSIKDYTGEVKPLGSHVLTPYIFLYYQIKDSMDFVENYYKLVNSIKDEKNR